MITNDIPIMSPTPFNWLTIVQAIAATVAATGTIAVAILAIWGDWLRSKLIPPILTIQLYHPRGTLTKFFGPDPKLNNKRVIYYHLKVVNSRHWSPARNCRVLLRGISTRVANQEFVPIPMAVPGQFVWAPAATTPPTITLSKEHIFDFGYYYRRFRPLLTSSVSLP